mgnify:CR=1 FL=1
MECIEETIIGSPVFIGKYDSLPILAHNSRYLLLIQANIECAVFPSRRMYVHTVTGFRRVVNLSRRVNLERSRGNWLELPRENHQRFLRKYFAEGEDETRFTDIYELSVATFCFPFWSPSLLD